MMKSIGMTLRSILRSRRASSTLAVETPLSSTLGESKLGETASISSVVSQFSMIALFFVVVYVCRSAINLWRCP